MKNKYGSQNLEYSKIQNCGNIRLVIELLRIIYCYPVNRNSFKILKIQIKKRNSKKWNLLNRLRIYAKIHIVVALSILVCVNGTLHLNSTGHLKFSSRYFIINTKHLFKSVTTGNSSGLVIWYQGSFAFNRNCQRQFERNVYPNGMTNTWQPSHKQMIWFNTFWSSRYLLAIRRSYLQQLLL